MPPPLLLLVDDAPEILHIVKLLARRSGQQLLTHASATSVLDALRVPGVPRPDLLLLDIHLPGVSGIELYRHLREEPNRVAGVPAALFSQSVPSGLLAEALDAGIDFVVSKELLGRPESWKERIDEVLHQAAHPPTPIALQGPVDPRRLAEGMRAVLLHPVMGRLGDEAIQALWRRASSRAAGQCRSSSADVDMSLSSGSLASYLTRLVADPDHIARLVLYLGYQVECLLGRTASDPLLAILSSLLNGDREG